MSLKSETDEIYDDLKKEKREKNPEKAKKKTVILFIVICSVLFVFMGLAAFIPSYIFSNKTLDNVYEFMGDKAYDKITVIKLDEYKLKNVSVKTDNESGDTFFIWIEDVKSIEYFTERYCSISLFLSGYVILSLFLAMFLKTQFTKPLSPVNPRFVASFTASLHTAESGILSIYIIWYTDISHIFLISGFIFLTGVFEYWSII